MAYRATNDTKVEESGKYVSSIGYAESKDGVNFERSEEPILVPDQDYEMGLGCEDPRITKIDDTYFMYYTAVNGIGPDAPVRIALATSKDFKNWEKHGIVGPESTSKAAALFPERINDQYVVFYTWMSDTPMSTIMEARFDSLDDLKNPPQGYIASNVNNYDKNSVFEPPKNSFRGPEVGAVPIKTDEGWLFIYCSANATDYDEWTVSAALLDLEDPKKIIGITQEPILRPETKSEKVGVMNNVTFPEGAVVVDDKLYVYYGSADQGICLATCDVEELISALK